MHHEPSCVWKQKWMTRCFCAHLGASISYSVRAPVRGHVRTNAPSPERSEHHTAPSGAVTIAGPVMRPFVPSQHAGGCGTSTCRVACVFASMCSRLGSAV